MTLLTTPDNEFSVVAEIRAILNMTLLNQNLLKSGDVLVLDNASVRVGTDAFKVVCRTLDLLDIRLLLLPMYSPELNPAEYVFSFLKTNLRSSRDHVNYRKMSFKY